MVCKFHGSNGNGFGDSWWTDNPIYFSSIDGHSCYILGTTIGILFSRGGHFRGRKISRNSIRSEYMYFAG